MHITGILLAAGQSQRFGSPKLRHILPQQQLPLILASAQILQPWVKQLLVVVRPDDIELQRLLTIAGYTYVICEASTLGMGHSLACGVQASATADAWLVALADMPFIQAQTIQRLVTHLENGVALVAPYYRGKRGHPVGFAHQFYTPLSQLTGDSGARAIIEAHITTLLPLHGDDKGILQDIDTIDDLPPA
ncbi:putative MobA-like protein [Beggiatoa alba B18LD]|uniref:Putative MobA-like protein n=1 Tax=Beggiatoa alba B18LD TaxID=395493 RepID=I3CJF5_9GAMM|nr:nucleotidyltransferase family protein [Beggiatoa alba]EIJ43748.1 putative MobA-like protein [Beggiatoa alba B18LD]